ncbi:MAG: hypothetical protein NTU85_03295 [Candidatus Kaiserbacteria bacterium]|nr:hypothetical protein [Candidatus Kaiserbacteria bacterium]
MSWAARRRFIILLIVSIVIAAFLAILLIATLYKTPSCTDGVKNQNEAGIDCGGPCSQLCTSQVQPPVVLFTKVLRNADGRTDVIALVENKNANAAAKDIPYNVTLYGVNNILIKKVSGTLDLPPRETEPVYISGIASGKQKVISAFLEIDASTSQWFTMAANSRIMPTVLNTTKGGTASEPRIEAILANPSVVTMTNVQAVVLVFNARKEVIAASRTVIPSIPGQGQASATFTWNNPFPSVPALIEVLPIIPLP